MFMFKWLFGCAGVLIAMFLIPAVLFGAWQGLSIGDMIGANRLMSNDRAELSERCAVAFPGKPDACGCFIGHANKAEAKYTPYASRDYIYDHIADGDRNLANANLMLIVDWSTVTGADREAARQEMQSFVKTCFGASAS